MVNHPHFEQTKIQICLFCRKYEHGLKKKDYVRHFHCVVFTVATIKVAWSGSAHLVSDVHALKSFVLKNGASGAVERFCSELPRSWTNCFQNGHACSCSHMLHFASLFGCSGGRLLVRPCNQHGGFEHVVFDAPEHKHGKFLNNPNSLATQKTCQRSVCKHIWPHKTNTKPTQVNTKRHTKTTNMAVSNMLTLTHQNTNITHFQSTKIVRPHKRHVREAFTTTYNHNGATQSANKGSQNETLSGTYFHAEERCWFSSCND